MNTHNGNDKKIINLLLVEDDQDFSAALIPRLEKRHCTVTVVPSAENVLDILKQRSFDVIVSDIKLPGMDGITLLEKIREIDKHIPVILVTGYASLETAKEAVKLNAFDYLLKPLDSIEDLIDPIQKAVYNRELVLANNQLENNLKRKINELEVSEDKYRDLFELASDIIFTVNTEGIITSANKQMEEITKYAKEELLGKNSAELFISVEDNAHYKKSQEVLAGKKRDVVAVEIVTKDKQNRLGQMSMRPIKKDNTVLGIQCIVQDLTEFTRAEEQRLAIVREKAMIVDTLAEAVVVVEPNGRIISANAACKKMFGLTPGEIIGKNFNELPEWIAPDDTKKLIETAEAIVEGSITNSIELNVSKKSGEKLSMGVTVGVIKDNHDNFEKLIFSMRDITENKKMDQEMKKKMHALEVFHKVAVEREHRMIDLKKEISKLTTEIEMLKKTK